MPADYDNDSDALLMVYMTGRLHADRSVKLTARIDKERRKFWKRKLYGSDAEPYITPCTDYLYTYHLERAGWPMWHDPEAGRRILDGGTDGWQVETLREYYDDDQIRLFLLRRQYVLALAIEQWMRYRASGSDRVQEEPARFAKLPLGWPPVITSEQHCEEVMHRLKQFRSCVLTG